MKSTASTLYLVALATFAVADRTFTVKNNCAYTVWPALYAPPNLNSAAPSQAPGWELSAGGTTTFTVPDAWVSGLLWARTDCDFSTVQSSASCATGGCDGGLVCTGPPVDGTPVTVAEFTFTVSPSVPDNTDVSIVDGFNVPIRVDNNAGCPISTCPVNLTPICPTALQYKDASGAVVGCLSDCQVDPDPANSPSCCTGSYNTAATCPPSHVPDYAFFKNNCPDSYVYAYDESSGTPLFVCSAKPGYTITFCP
ncbi:unnamed protein product [Peniophora sp. CBMAI 1063]|nr:unnamed protein product [Peniophora sp. CBMAI 1063]